MTKDLWRCVRFTDYDESCTDAASSLMRDHLQDRCNFKVIHDSKGFLVVKTK